MKQTFKYTNKSYRTFKWSESNLKNKPMTDRHPRLNLKFFCGSCSGLAEPTLFPPFPQTYHKGEGEVVGRKVTVNDLLKGRVWRSCVRDKC
jgi:hypothetical protein